MRPKGREHAGKYPNCVSNLLRLSEGLEKYAKDNRGSYPEALSELVPQYLEAVPQCKAAGADTYSESYFTEQREVAVITCPKADKNPTANCRDDAAGLRTMVTWEKRKNGEFPEDIDSILALGERDCSFHSVPMSYQIKVIPAYTVFCKGSHHEFSPENHPHYDSVDGFVE